MGDILGRQHPTLRRLRALRRDAGQRRDESVFIAEGLHLGQEALRSNAAIEVALYSSRLTRNDEGRRLLAAFERRGIDVREASDAALDAVCDARSPQPIVTVVRRPPAPVPTLDAATLIVVAHGLQDPGNLGSLMRTAEAGWATGLCVCGTSVDPYHPRSVRAGMGAIFRLPPWIEPPDALLERLRAGGVRNLAIDAAGTSDHLSCDFSGPIALWLGGEGQGLPAETRAELDASVRIPMRRGVESLSVGAAAAVVLFEAARRRGSFNLPA